MYGVPQTGILANKQLTERLATRVYHPCKHMPGLWKHEWRPVWFTLKIGPAHDTAASLSNGIITAAVYT
eukprot:3577489-Ditylum_brightwellii.AAC.1